MARIFSVTYANLKQGTVNPRCHLCKFKAEDCKSPVSPMQIEKFSKNLRVYRLFGKQMRGV